MALNAFDRPVEPGRRVDAVGQQIARHAASCCGGIESPESLPSLRQSRRLMVQSCRNLAR